MWKNLLLFTLFSAILWVSAPFVLANCHSGGFIPNPIAYCDFPALLCAVTNAVRDIGIVFAVLAIVIIGFKFLQASAAGNEAGIKDARKYFLWVLIGTAVVVGASVIAGAVINFLNGGTGFTC